MIIIHFDLEIKIFDIINAFINAIRDPCNTLMACQFPDGFKAPGICIEIDRALYGMRDSPSLWYNDFSSKLKKLGLIACKEEPCLFMNEQRTLFVVFFIDDVQVLYHRDDTPIAQSFINQLKGAYELRDLGDIEWFLGIRVIRDRATRKIWLVHDTYIEKIAQKFGLDG